MLSSWTKIHYISALGKTTNENFFARLNHIDLIHEKKHGKDYAAWYDQSTFELKSTFKSVTKLEKKLFFKKAKNDLNEKCMENDSKNSVREEDYEK